MNQLKVVLIFVIIFLLYKICNKKDVIEGWDNKTGNSGYWAQNSDRNPEHRQWQTWYDWFRYAGHNNVRRESNKSKSGQWKTCMSDTRQKIRLGLGGNQCYRTVHIIIWNPEDYKLGSYLVTTMV